MNGIIRYPLETGSHEDYGIETAGGTPAIVIHKVGHIKQKKSSLPFPLCD